MKKILFVFIILTFLTLPLMADSPDSYNRFIGKYIKVIIEGPKFENGECIEVTEDFLVIYDKRYDNTFYIRFEKILYIED